MKKKYNSAIVVTILVLGIVFGIQIEKSFSSDTIRENVIKFNHVLTFASKYYQDDIDNNKLAEAAIIGMMKELDPHSVYLPPKKQKDEQEKFDGNFTGIGIEYQIISDTIVVVSPITGGPCEAVGVMAGDKIVTVDGKSCIGFTNSEVRKNFRGTKGSKVDIGISRIGQDNIIDFEIIRDKIPIYSVASQLMWDNETGYVSLSRFAKTSTKEVLEALHQLKNQGMKRLVFDLRNNPGGLLSQAFSISDIFIDGQKKIVYTRGRRSELDQEFSASIKTEFENIPLIILVNRGSASASEIVSGAVQDWDRGLIVGETTFGKGLVQRVFSLPDRSAIRLTTSKYYTPSGRQIQRNYDDKENYYKDVHKREEVEGENLSHKSEQDTIRPVFNTNNGRKVFGGGGITPDFIIKPGFLTEYSTKLRRSDVYYLFVRMYLESNKMRISEIYGDNLIKFKKEFSFENKDIESFKKFAESKKIEFVEKEFNKDKEYILTRLKGYIAREFWKNKGWYFILLENDKVFQKSNELFGEVEKLANF